MPSIGLHDLPPELVLQILEWTIAEYDDPLSSILRQESYRTLLPLAHLSRSFQHPAQSLLHRTLGFSDAITGELYLDADQESNFPLEFGTQTLLLYGAGLVESTGITAVLARKIIAKTRGLQSLRLCFIGKLEEDILSLPQLADLASLELMTAILPSSRPVVLPSKLSSLSLSTWKYPPLFVPSLLRASASTLTSLSISLAASTPDLDGILDAFQLVAPILHFLDLTNLSPLPSAFPPLLSLCPSLTRLQHLTLSRIEELHTLLASTPSRIEKLSTKVFLRDITPENVALLDDCLALDSMSALKEWSFAQTAEAPTVEAKAFLDRCRESGPTIRFGC